MIRTSHIWITASEIRKSKDIVYIYGGNLMHRETGGQARVAARFVWMKKAFPIPTKRAPSMQASAFFSDQEDEIKAVKNAFIEILKFIKKGKKIVFFPGIGEGRAKLPERSPIIFAMIRDFINTHQKLDLDKLRGIKS